MKVHKLLLAALLATLTGHLSAEQALTARPDIRLFIDEMVQQHDYQAASLERLFEQVELRPDIIETMTRPAEGKPWHAYRPIFLTEDRVREGVTFWQENQALLQQAEDHFGVAAQYIVAILGVETRYGRFRGKHRVIDALSTLAFDYPPRSKFFRSELMHYLLMSREESIDPLSLTGSYAGAMGTPQFIPSSFRAYAIDFDGDGRRDLFSSTADIVGSVANYFKVHGWVKDGSVAIAAHAAGDAYRPLLEKGLKPHTTAGELAALGITPRWNISPAAPVALLELAGENAPEHWVTFNNFYVITRYNRSPLYAMAVHQLSEAIRKAYAAAGS